MVERGRRKKDIWTIRTRDKRERVDSGRTSAVEKNASCFNKNKRDNLDQLRETFDVSN